MFIVHLSNGETLTEGKNCSNWDAVPKEGISSLELQTFSGEIITLPKCEEYFYSIEAVSQVGLISSVSSVPIITAKIIGGIIGDKAIMLRADTRGHINIQYLNKSELPFKEFVYKKGN